MRGRLFLFGCFLAVFLMLVSPSINAVEYSVAEKVNKDFLSRETHRFIDRFRGFNGLFHIVSRLRGIDFADINSLLNIDLSFILTILIIGVIVPTVIITMEFFILKIIDLLGYNLLWPVVNLVMSFIAALPISLTYKLIAERYGDTFAILVTLAFLIIDLLIALKIFNLIVCRPHIMD